MMDLKRTGGPAFPMPETENYGKWNGMNLRDYFAAVALQGIVASHKWTEEDEKHYGDTADDFAWRAWMIADAMTAWREVDL